MRKSKLAAALISVIFLASSITLATADSKPIEQFSDPGPTVKNVGGYTGILVDDTELLTNQPSNMIGMYYEKVNGNWNQKQAFVCRAYSDPNCSNAQNIWYDAVLDVCKSDAETNCILRVTAIKDGKEITGKFAQSYPETSKYTFKGDASRNIPDGGLPSLWSFNGINHQGGDKFLVQARYFHNGNIYGGDSVNLSPSEFTAGIFAMSVDKNPMHEAFDIVTEGANKPPGKAWGGSSSVSKNGCFAAGIAGECAIGWPLPSDIRFRLEIRTSIPLTSFLHGRLLNPEIKITTDLSSRQIFSIEGGAVAVPILQTWVKNSDMPKGLYDVLYAQTNFGGWYYYQDGKGSGRDNVQVRIPVDAYTSEYFQQYLWWLEVAKDKSIGSKTMWVARTLSSAEIFYSGTQKCLGDTKNLTGMVTTNADMYISAPPTFNEAAQSLDYKVSSPHFDDTGKLNVGNYNLVLSSEAARCLYNFSKAPISATVSIVSADGTAQVATTTVNEKNGWLYLSANGFTYSSPTVRVKLTQEAKKPVVTPTPTPSASTAPIAVPKLLTISCVKGKITKKVTAAKPVCPAGYKKK
jgi:hypothetical protein